HLQRVVCLGGETTEPPGGFQDLPETLRRPGVLHVCGHQPEQRIAEILACCDLAFSGYPAPLLGKSSSASAYALAGLPILVAARANDPADSAGPPAVDAETWDWSRVA